jgi:hypothetical protein
MSDLTNQLIYSPQTRAMKATGRPRCLTAIVAGLLLTTMSFLTGCGGGGETGSDPTVKVNPGSAGATATASLDWNPVPDSTVSAYFVHYGRQSPHQPGSCAYEHSISVDSPSATLTNLDPNTTYYFAVSAYNGLESACSNEVSTST